MCIISNISLLLIKRNLQGLNKIIFDNLFFITKITFIKSYTKTLIFVKQSTLITSLLI